MPSASTSDSQSEADQCEYINKKEKLFTFTSKTNLYIRGLNENTTDKDLYEMCKKFETIFLYNFPLLICKPVYLNN